MKPGATVVGVTCFLLLGQLACGLTASPGATPAGLTQVVIQPSMAADTATPPLGAGLASPAPSSAVAAFETPALAALPDTPTALGTAQPQPAATAGMTEPATRGDTPLQKLAVNQPLHRSDATQGLEPLTTANADRIQPLVALGNSPAKYTHWAVSPDGRLFALNIQGAPKEQIEIEDIQTGEHVVLDGQGEAMLSAQFSPDGNYLASWWYIDPDHSAVEVWEARSGTVWAAAFKQGGETSGLAFSPDGRRLAFQHGAEITAWSVETGKVEMVYRTDGQDYASLGYSPDGMLVVAGGKQSIDVWDAQTGARQFTLSGNRTYAFLSFSADSQLLAAPGQDAKEVKLWDLSTGQLKTTLLGHTDDVIGLAFSPDSTLLASYSGEGPLRLWDAQTGAAKGTLTGFKTYVQRAAFSPDGAYLVTAEYAGGPVRLHNLLAGTAVVLSQETTAFGPTSFAFSPGGDLVAVMDNQGIALWAMKPGKAVAKLPILAAGQGRLGFSPTGTFIAYVPVAGQSTLFGVVSSAAARSGVSVIGATVAEFRPVIPVSWLAVDPVPARYEIRIDEKRVDTLTCNYSGNHALIHTRVDVTVTVTDLKTNTPVASRSFPGPAPVACKQVEDFVVGGALTVYRYDTPDVADFKTWVYQTMAPYGFK